MSAAGKKLRVYEIAKDLKMSSDAVVEMIRALGVEVRGHMSTVDPSIVGQLHDKMAREKEVVKEDLHRKHQQAEAKAMAAQQAAHAAREAREAAARAQAETQAQAQAAAAAQAQAQRAAEEAARREAEPPAAAAASTGATAETPAAVQAPVVTARIKTAGLAHDGAWVELSLTDHEGHVLQHRVTQQVARERARGELVDQAAGRDHEHRRQQRDLGRARPGARRRVGPVERLRDHDRTVSRGSPPRRSARWR